MASLCLVLPALLPPTAAHAAPEVATGSAAPADQLVRLSDAQLRQLEAKDLSGYRERYRALSGSAALASLLVASVGAAAADRQVQELAATTTSKMVAEFNQQTRGKSFVPTSVNGEWSLALVDSPRRLPPLPRRVRPR